MRTPSGSSLAVLIAAAALAVPAGQAAGAWSAGGEDAASGAATKTSIVFWRACGTGCGDVYAVDPRGYERRLTNGRRAIQPAWSADRRSIVFASDADTAGRYALYRRRLADGRETQRRRRAPRRTRLPPFARTARSPSCGRRGRAKRAR